MGIFSKTTGTGSLTSSSYGDITAQLGLPFYVPGDSHPMVDCMITYMGNDRFKLEPSGAFSGGYTVDPYIIKDVMDGKAFPQYDLYRMTPEEQKEYEALQQEYYVWKRQEQLKLFKQLPSHVRQEVVDECIIMSLVDRAHPNLNAQQNFHGWKRLKELKDKEEPRMFEYADREYEQFKYKYGPIINKFTLEELSNAHAEASLEDEIAD